MGLMDSGVGGLGGLIFGNPGFNSATLDQGTQDLINKEADHATSLQSNNYANNDLAGTHGSVDTTGTQHFNTALGGPQDSNLQAALQARAQRSMDSSLNQLQRQAQVAGTGQQARQMQSAFGDVTRQQDMANRANAAQMQAYQNNQKTRSSIVSGLFGSAGTIAGFMGGGAGGLGGGSGLGADNPSLNSDGTMNAGAAAAWGEGTTPFSQEELANGAYGMGPR